MKNSMFRLLFVVSLSVFCSLSLASPKESNMDRLLMLSGLTKQIGEMPGMVKAGFAQGLEQGVPLPESVVSLMLESADKTILPSVILDEIQLSLEAELNDADIETLLEWYESDIGKSITAAEERASTLAAYEDMMNSAPQLFANTKRVEAAVRLDELVGATDMTMEVQEFSGVAVYSAIMTATAPDQDLDLEAYNSQMAKLAPQMRENIQQFMIMSFVYSYLETDDDSLAKYEEFLDRPITRKFNESVIDGLSRGFGQVVTNWAGDIASTMKDIVERKSQSEV